MGRCWRERGADASDSRITVLRLIVLSFPFDRARCASRQGRGGRLLNRAAGRALERLDAVAAVMAD